MGRAEARPFTFSAPILFFLFSGKGETDGIFFLLLQKENAWQKKKEAGETFQMVPPDPFY